MRKTLFDRLTPAAREQLMQEKSKYTFTVNNVLKSLSDAKYWSDLTIEQANRVLLYSNCDMFGVDRYTYRTLMYGDDRIIQPENDII